MSCDTYEQWLSDGYALASRIPEANDLHQTSHNLIAEAGPNGVEIPAFHAERGQAYGESATAQFVVVCNDTSRPSTCITMPGNAVAVVTNDKARPELYLPTYNPNNSAGNGMLVLHELVHVNQLLKKPDTEETAVRYRSIKSIEQCVGNREREAYGLNIAILKSIDGDSVDEYIDGWPREVYFRENGGHTFGAIRFNEARSPLVPRPKQTMDPWETLTLPQRAWNIVANRKVLLSGFPKPPHGTFMRELWDEGTISKRVLQSVGRMAILEKEFEDKLPPDEIDRIAGAKFACIS